MNKPGLARARTRATSCTSSPSTSSTSGTRKDADFREWVRQAVRDPASALDLFLTYGRLTPQERDALREAIRDDGDAMGLDTQPLTRALGVIDALVEQARPWRAYVHGDGVVVGAPGRGALAAKNGRVRLHRRFDPPEGGAQVDVREVDVKEAVDRLAALLWDARQRGDRWPNRLAEFADLFDR